MSTFRSFIDIFRLYFDCMDILSDPHLLRGLDMTRPRPDRLIGYARASTDEQATEAQKIELRSAGCDDIIQEYGSGASCARPALAPAASRDPRRRHPCCRAARSSGALRQPSARGDRGSDCKECAFSFAA